MASSTKMPGLSVLAARPSPADGTDEPGDVAELLATLLVRLLAHHDRVVVASPPPLAGLQAAMLLVVPSRDGRCEVIRDVISPLKEINISPEKRIADTPDLLVATPVPEAATRHIGEEETPKSARPDDDSAPPPTTDDVVTRCYYLSPEAIGSLRVFSRTLSDRLGRQIKLSELVSVAIRTSPVLEQAEQLGRSGARQARTFYLRRPTLIHLTQLALLASRALGSHVSLSDVVDLAIRLFCAQPPDRQIELLEANRRKREHRA